MDELRRDNFISVTAADRLIAAHDGDVALLYIYLSRTENASLEQAARDLCRTMREITAAQEKLARMGLLPGAPVRPEASAPAAAIPSTAPELPAQPARQLPEYNAEEIARRSREDGAFSVILQEAMKVVGHALSGSDMKLLFGIYDYLALPPEVILELLNYCAEVYAQRYGASRRPSVRAIEKEAYVWANREILTLEQAEEYIRFQRDRQGDMGRIKAVIGIQNRELTNTEAKYLSSWLDLGFQDEAIAIAYDRTVTNTGSLKWGYMNKILLSWHEKNLHSPEQIEAGDSRRKAPSAASQTANRQIDMDELRSILDKI